ncbi:MAG TPA: outer membrane beta-barrel protein, partial [Nitrosospira sp.]
MNRMQKCINPILLFAVFTLFPAIAKSSTDTYSADHIANLLRDTGVKVGGWINGGVTYNANNPANGYNGTVTFADRTGEPQLNQFNIFFQRTVVTEGKAFDIGGRFDFMFGTDAIYTQAFGIPASDVNT